MSNYRYWGRGSSMSVDLKHTIRRVRTARPELFTGRRVRESSMDGDGKVTVTERVEVRAQPLSGAVRHRLSFQRERF